MFEVSGVRIGSNILVQVYGSYRNCTIATGATQKARQEANRVIYAAYKG